MDLLYNFKEEFPLNCCTIEQYKPLVIQISNVTLVRENKAILRNVSWKVVCREHWAVLGANGSGKTMLLKMVNGYVWPSQGTMTILGKRFGAVDLRDLRKSIGWVSSALQENIPRNEKALDVVLSGKFASIGLWEKATSRYVKRAFELLRFIGYEQLAAQTFGALSQGEQQSILIARSLMPRPRLLIFDEPCIGLDVYAR